MDGVLREEVALQLRITGGYGCAGLHWRSATLRKPLCRVAHRTLWALLHLRTSNEASAFLVHSLMLFSASRCAFRNRAICQSNCRSERHFDADQSGVYGCPARRRTTA